MVRRPPDPMPARRARALLERGRTHAIILGVGRTLMLACLSPSSAHLDESMNTLHFASRAKNIANRPAVQIDQQAVPALLSTRHVAVVSPCAHSRGAQALVLHQLQISMQTLQEENLMLQQKLMRVSSAAPQAHSPPSSPPTPAPTSSLPPSPPFLRA